MAHLLEGFPQAFVKVLAVGAFVMDRCRWRLGGTVYGIQRRSIMLAW